MTQNLDTAVIRTIGLEKYYGIHQVLFGVDFSITEGERVVIMGSSGSGKSTFIRCLNGLESTQGGHIQFHGRDIEALAERDWRPLRRRIGMVFQDFALFPHMTVLNNLTFAPVREGLMKKAAAEERALALLERVKLRGKERSFPSQLSGGQQQRVAIVRSMMMSPEVMLFDEPTSALDPETVGEVLAIIQDLTSEGLTSIIVTHETNFARKCANRIVYMDAGKIVEEGSPEKFFTSPDTERARSFIASHN
ncbi:amino acid ABC transporter ATP-binding protein [Rhizobium sp. L1K21]|uniref:amino acid ABC transporter ATP-binding protein n=1 Tax=Rhizobium sp. L1K21 TaxID=2954933 RepID=UPI002091E987|nr:amino acid ABC transporter ATP-binding protein [Rhizobium sp. L1K21]MCO6187607.1 amino acid ABC transporter ATP-binding protein [Rhizobium sp. L1K21]